MPHKYVNLKRDEEGIYHLAMNEGELLALRSMIGSTNLVRMNEWRAREGYPETDKFLNFVFGQEIRDFLKREEQ